jgi:hypothetical protein
VTATRRALALSLTLMLAAIWGASAAQAKPEVFKFDYAGYGSFEDKSQVNDSAGCRRNEDWIGQYSFRQDWKVHAAVSPHRIAVERNAEYVGAPGLATHPTSIEVTGTQTSQPQENCAWAGGPNDNGRYQCGDDHPQLTYDKVLHLTHLVASKTILFGAPAFIGYNPALRGTNTVPSLKATGCAALAYSPGQYLVGPDIEVKIPIKAATLYHLKRGHFFFVHTGLGHYTVRPDQTGHSCFLVTHGPQDFCKVTADKYVGEIAVKRIS